MSALIAVYILLGLLLCIALLLSSPVSLYFYYREEARLTLRIWGIPTRLLPLLAENTPRKTHKKPKTTAKTKPPSESKRSALLRELQETFREDGVGAVLYWLQAASALLKKTAGRLLRAITVKKLRLEMRVSGEDAAAAAIQYGEVCAAVYPLLSLLLTGMRVKTYAVRIQPDFSEDGAAVLAEVRLRVSLWKLAGALCLLAGGALRLYFMKEQTDSEKERTVIHG